MMRTRILMLALTLVALLPWTAIGKDDGVTKIPDWAKVAPEQIAAAKKRGVAVAFENKLKMRFVLVPAGSFVMGSPRHELGRDDDELQHKVTLTTPYYVQITEVTNAQYRQFKKHHDSGTHNLRRTGKILTLNADNQPVVEVSWKGACAFLEWLGRSDGRKYRLPTEAEWEYATRAGTKTAYSFGVKYADLVKYGNSGDQQLRGVVREEFDDGHAVTAPVGSYKPNPWGLYDVHGNVWEWTADIFAPYPSVHVKDPTGPVTGSGHAWRGGSWWDHASGSRSAQRVGTSDRAGFHQGFRATVSVVSAKKR